MNFTKFIYSFHVFILVFRFPFKFRLSIQTCGFIFLFVHGSNRLFVLLMLLPMPHRRGTDFELHLITPLILCVRPLHKHSRVESVWVLSQPVRLHANFAFEYLRAETRIFFHVYRHNSKLPKTFGRTIHKNQ